MSGPLIALLLAGTPAADAAATLPRAIRQQLPAGYVVLAAERLADKSRAKRFVIVAIGRRDESAGTSRSRPAPARPLLIYEQRAGGFALVGRNDHVVLRADEGGQCDPFLDGAAAITVKGRFFTVENGVACGQHWTDFVTFRLDPARGFVFDNRRTESWTLNPSNAPDAEALIRDGPPRLVRDPPGRHTRFADWRPPR